LLTVSTKTLKSEQVPVQLPAELLPALVRTKRVLLCLDYDGTISEIVQDPALARPVPGIPEVLAEFVARRDRIAVAIVSGREVAALQEFLHIPRGIALSGIHGLELVDFEGSEEILQGARECTSDLEEVHGWLDKNVPAGEGFTVEDKRFAVTLHYRNAPAAMARNLRDALAQFVHDHAPRLAMLDSKMATEALPKSTSKAGAVRALWRRAGRDFEPVYFGDDLTDEDAFRELKGRGVTVLVGRQRPSAARYRVESPSEVARVLKAMAATLAGLTVEPAAARMR
jgi:trehalose-phosphatase